MEGMGRTEGWSDRRNERSPATFTRNDIAVASLSIMRRDRCFFRPLYLWRKIYNGAEDVDASGYWRWNVLSKTLRKAVEVEAESVWATIVLPSRERLIARRSMSTWPSSVALRDDSLPSIYARFQPFCPYFYLVILYHRLLSANVYIASNVTNAFANFHWNELARMWKRWSSLAFVDEPRRGKFVFAKRAWWCKLENC